MDEYQAYSENIRENIDMESLMKRYPYEQKDVQEIYNLIVEIVVGKGGSMTISGQQYPRELVKSRFLKPNMSHVEYVMECLRKNTTKVYNIKIISMKIGFVHKICYEGILGLKNATNYKNLP